MAKRIQLETDKGQEYTIIGIASHIRDFRIAYHLNKNLFLDLEKKADLKAEISGHDHPGLFSFYTYQEKENFIDFYLVSNKNQDGTLIPELKQADYFLLVKGPFPKESMDRFMKTIKEIPNVMTSFRVDVTRQKKILQLFMEIELHCFANLKL